MSRTIVIDPVTRIEGHSKITIQLDDRGEVADAHFHVTQFRGFERITQGEASALPRQIRLVIVFDGDTSISPRAVALEQALEPYIIDRELRRTHGCAGRERVLQNFGLDAMIQRYLDLYDELLNCRPATHVSSAPGVKEWPKAG